MAANEDPAAPACPTGTERRPYGPNRTRHSVNANACVKSNVIGPKTAIRAQLHAYMQFLGYTKGVDYIAYVRVMPTTPPPDPANCSCMCGCS